jgi:diaminohydroxyphosphoribosylaminopyrimidine deaminase / 5-amino-6-(5-phosphoribosylamino)uracil reductase
MFTPSDHEHMAHALRLAQRGLYTTTPNPRVGCVIVREGRVIAEGYHERAGQAHAEVAALAAARESVRGATAYVTLEPCTHHGRTPPCTDALLVSGVHSVVAAMEDPNPEVRGKGFARLAAGGIATACGLLEEQARELNVGFVTRMTLGRPWVRIKTAASLDGRTALANGLSQWITSPPARRDAHRWRARSCAVMAGIGTLLADNPRLTVRDIETTRQPLRIVVDRDLRIPLDAAVLADGNALIATARAASAKRRELEARGVTVLELPDAERKVDLAGLMRELGKRGLNEVLVESGNRLNGALLRAQVVDELIVFLAPHLLGDTARGMFDLGVLSTLGERRNLAIREVRQVGHDLRIIARMD